MNGVLGIERRDYHSDLPCRYHGCAISSVRARDVFIIRSPNQVNTPEKVISSLPAKHFWATQVRNENRLSGP